jgi:DNA topoisomerase VI subunit B
MFGFGNAEAAILQCAKELLENSMDALKERNPYEISQGSIKICITGNA